MSDQDTSRVIAYEVGEELGEGASDHRVQALTLDMDASAGEEKVKDKPAFMEQWDLAHMTDTNWEVFAAACDGYMVDWMADFEPTGPQDPVQAGVHVEQWLKAFNQAGIDVIGRRKVGSGSKGWYPELLPVLEARREAGKDLRESVGAEKVAAKARLEELRRKLRSVSKRCRHEAELKRLRSVDSSLSSSASFWKNVRTMHKATAGGGSLPSAVLDAQGELVTDPLKVLQTWRDFTRELGREDPIPEARSGHSDRREAPTKYDDDFARDALDRLRTMFVGDGVPELDKIITWDEVHTNIQRLQSGKAAGLDGVLTEMLHKAGLGCALALAQLFNYVWDNSAWPVAWQKAFMVPRYKKAGSKLEPGNYRNLSIMSIVAKLFEKIVDSRIREWAERVHALSDLQGGFRTDRSTVDQLFILNEIVLLVRVDPGPSQG